MGNTSSKSIKDKRGKIDKCRPVWPYGGWVEQYIDKDLPTNNSFKKAKGRAMCRFQRHKTFSSNESDNVNGLQAFLRVFDKDLEVFETEKGREVHRSVNSIMESSVTSLQKRCPKLIPCRLIKTGSVPEGTKVGEMDEFDFLIVVNTLKNRSSLRFSDFKLLLLEEIRKVINRYDDWTFLETFDPKRPELSHETDSLATTVHLHSDKYDIDVDIDICACVSLLASEVDNINWLMSIDKSEELIKQIVVHSFPDKECFLILADNFFYNTRLTIPSFEISPFIEFGRKSGQVKTYRYAKCIVNRLFPKYNRFLKCYKCIICFVKSYHLKTIILFMMKNHENPSMWSDANVPNRVLEVFDIIVECIRESDRSEVRTASKFANIAQFYTPGAVHLKLFCNYDPKYGPDRYTERLSRMPICRNGATFLGEYIYPDYSGSLKTGIASIDQTVKAYFDSLQNDYWESFMLIFRVREMLHKLKEMEQI